MCALKLFRINVALDKDEEQVSFINMRIKALCQCLDQDEEIGAKHIANTERFQATSRELIPLLAGIDLDDELIEDPMVAQICNDSSKGRRGKRCRYIDWHVKHCIIKTLLTTNV